MQKTILILLILLPIIGFPLIAGGKMDKKAREEITLQGQLILTGNDPHTRLILQCRDKEKYLLTGKLIEEMKQAAPGQTIQLSGFFPDKNKEEHSDSPEPVLFEVLSWEGERIQENLLPDRMPGS